MELCEKHELELKEAIKVVHKMYYDGSFLESTEKALSWHRSLEILFNWAKIEESLIENNQNEVSPEEFKERYGL